MARVATPLELVVQSLDLRSTSAVLFSAGGRNPDILAAFEHLVVGEPRNLFVVCGTADSPLARRAAEVAFATLVHVPNPRGKDGFLATNSLLSFVGSLGVAFAACYPDLGPAPSKLPAEWGTSESFAPLRGNEHLLVIYDPLLRHAAIDIESRFSEAALGTVSLADFRNFAHGRHLWLAQRGERTTVVALFRTQLVRVAEKTLSLLPKDIAALEWRMTGSLVGDIIQSLYYSMHLAGVAGLRLNVDPGRPHVPQFGRQLYNARLISGTARTGAELAVYRKVGIPQNHELGALLAAFLDRLKKARLGAVVLDYDGTLCSHAARYGDADGEALAQLRRLLQGGMRVGIATGRGKSVAVALRDALPEELRPGVVVGYYNCGLIVNLAEDPPDWTQKPDTGLRRVFDELSRDPLICDGAELELRDTQVMVTPRSGLTGCADLIALCATYAGRVGDGLTVVRSTHSIDILPRHVNKTLLLQHLRRVGDGEILTVGDQGRWPGNDYMLLDATLSLSVDGTSPSWSTCWNIAPRGLRGPAATAHYLNACKRDRHGWRINVPTLLGGGWE